MIDLQYEMELEKLNKDINACCDFSKLNTNDKEVLNRLNLFKYRTHLKKVILFHSKYESIECNREVNHIIKEFYELLLVRREKYPRFIFDEFDEERFASCLSYIKEGHSLRETEYFYLEKYIKQKTF